MHGYSVGLRYVSENYHSPPLYSAPVMIEQKREGRLKHIDHGAGQEHGLVYNPFDSQSCFDR